MAARSSATAPAAMATTSAAHPNSRCSPTSTAPWWTPRTSIDRKSTRLNSSHLVISYAVFCLKKKKHTNLTQSAWQDPPPVDPFTDDFPRSSVAIPPPVVPCDSLACHPARALATLFAFVLALV